MDDVEVAGYSVNEEVVTAKWRGQEPRWTVTSWILSR